MNLFPFFLTLALGIVGVRAFGQDKTPSELAPLQAQYDAKVKRDVFEPHQKAVVNLVAKYFTEVGHALESVQGGRKLEEIVALKAEKSLAESGQTPPPVDDTETPKTLKKLRSTFRLELARLIQERDRKWQPFRNEYAKSLESVVESLTRQGKVDDALAVKQLGERLKSPGLSIVGQWNIVHCNDVKNVWTFNKNYTYNYWNETGKFTYKNGLYHLMHTWDWDIYLVDDDTFEGFCSRGKTGCVIHAKRIK